jgi:hypothetical protein
MSRLLHSGGKAYTAVNESPLRSARNSLLVYDSVDLLAGVAALQLMPENSGRIIRLEAAAHVAASLPSRTTSRRIKSSYLDTILNRGALADLSIIRDEDPHEFAFTDSIAFIDGPFTVFPGIEDDSVFILQHLLNAIFRHRRQLQNKGYLNNAFHLASAVLRLSNEIARRAGLSGRTDPVYAPEHEVVIPNNTQFHRLKKAVVFDKSEIDEQLLREGIDPLGTLISILTICTRENYSSVHLFVMRIGM